MSIESLERLRERESQRVHLIGVAGSGMSGLASLLMGMGHQVSGSDRVTTLETERLEGLGLTFHSPQHPEEVDGVDMVIYSSAIKPGNVAYDAALEQGIPLVRRAEALSAIMDRCQGIVIAGTHGKTTTSSMAAHVLRSGGVKPSHYVGAEIPLLGTNAHWEGEQSYFVAEGDESDGTLALFRPSHALILNIEEEHLDHYSGIEEINEVFDTLLQQTKGFFLYCGDDPGAVAVCGDRSGGLSYGWNRSCDYAAISVTERRGTSTFEVLRGGEPLGEVELGIPGRHNVLNALGVVGLATELGVNFQVIRAAMGTFRGARRRFEPKYRSEFFEVFDDYGHHPTEIEATLNTARSLEPERLLCVFQPHRYSRTKLLRSEFGRCFHHADELFVTDIYPASEDPIEGISGETICEAVREVDEKSSVESTPTFGQARFLAGNRLRPGDLLISLGAGNVHEITSAIAEDLEVLDGLRAVLDEEGSLLRLYEPMKRHTTIRIGGPAQFWVQPQSVAGMARLVAHCRREEIPIRVVGRGSNLLIRDGGLAGVVIHPRQGDFEQIQAQGDCIEAGVGSRLKRIASVAQQAGLGGFEWMEGIPGNLGGSIRMNAGAMGTETFDQIVSVTFIDQNGDVQTKCAEDIQFQYRNVPEFTENYVVSAVLRGQPASEESIREGLRASKEKRKSSQPIAASAGCIFKNPGPMGAGQLVDELGLKEMRVGQARVSEVHANFIVNEGGATARQVLDLIAKIQDVAQQERGIALETEVQILGADEAY
ncbi:MAG: UDP-N-acetylmuramate--L-alanine ligase [Verrucomicrobiota bacterium]